MVFLLGKVKKRCFLCGMKKMRFPDKFRLTDRFLEGRISLVVDKVIPSDGRSDVVRDGKYWEFSDGTRVHCRYSEGDCVAVMMSYSRAGLSREQFGGMDGWTNPLKVRAEYMPHRMVVERVRCVRSSGLGEDEVLRAGVTRNGGGYYMVGGRCGGVSLDWREMFRRMYRIGKEDDPWLIVYDVTPVL